MQLKRMRHTQHLLPIPAMVLLSCFPAIAAAQTHTVPAHAPTQPQPLFANLTMPLDVTRVKVGSRIQARMIAPWSANGCDLRLTDLIEGHVSQVDHKTRTDKRSAIHIVFDSAECNRHRGTPLRAMIIALLGPSGIGAPGGESGVALAPSLTDVPALTTSGNAGAPEILTISSGFRSVLAASEINQFAGAGRTLPKSWTPGMVIDVPMNLTVGTGAEAGSIIWATKTDARLESQTTLILLAIPQRPPPPPAVPLPPGPLLTNPPATP